MEVEVDFCINVRPIQVGIDRHPGATTSNDEPVDNNTVDRSLKMPVKYRQNARHLTLTGHVCPKKYFTFHDVSLALAAAGKGIARKLSTALLSTGSSFDVVAPGIWINIWGEHKFEILWYEFVLGVGRKYQLSQINFSWALLLSSMSMKTHHF